MSGGPEYYIDLMMHTKVTPVHIRKKNYLVSKQVYQNPQREASKFNDSRY